MGVVLSLCGLRPEASPAQQVLSDTGRPGLPHLCVWSVLSYLVLHYHGGGAGAHRTEQGTKSGHPAVMVILNEEQWVCSTSMLSVSYLHWVVSPCFSFKVTHFSIVVTAKDFNPEKYAALSRILCRYGVQMRWHSLFSFLLRAFLHLSSMFLSIIQDVHQTWQSGENDGGLCHCSHQRNLPEWWKRLISNKGLWCTESIPGWFTQRWDITEEHSSVIWPPLENPTFIMAKCICNNTHNDNKSNAFVLNWCLKIFYIS